MGDRYMSFPPLNLENTHAESTYRIPFVCILSMGSDPTDMILNLAKKKKKEVQSVSMGQGQEIVARRYVDQGAVTGSWALFQNCHLGLKFLVGWHASTAVVLVGICSRIHANGACCRTGCCVAGGAGAALG
jgi:hypothetical protein